MRVAECFCILRHSIFYGKKEKKKIFWFCLAGFLFVGAFGAVSHFFYEWSGKEPLVGVFFAANESVWEHLKPAIFPTLVFFLIGSVFLDAPNVLPAFFATLILPMLLIPAIFYGYTAFTGEPIVAVDIATYFVSVAAAFALCFFVLTRPPLPKWVSRSPSRALRRCPSAISPLRCSRRTHPSSSTP